MGVVEIAHANVKAAVDTVAGMVTAEFCHNGKKFRPLYVRPWTKNEARDVILQNLKGDFFCLPFGGSPPENLPKDWRGRGACNARYPHGYSCNADWQVREKSCDTVTLTLEYGGDGIDCIERNIRAAGSTLYFEDVVHTASEVILPVGIHPVFALNSRPESMRLTPPPCSFFATYPTVVDATSILSADALFENMRSAPRKDGGTVDLTSLPLKNETEELIFAANVKQGRIFLDNIDEHWRVVLNWDKASYPNCMFWLSNRGRKSAPWNGRNLCLGIEPVDSAFDLGAEISIGDNPLKSKGVSTAHRFKRGKNVLRHNISLMGWD